MNLKRWKNVRHLLGAILGFFLIILGFVFRARKTALSGNYVTGLAFHNPNRKLFERSIKWLRNKKYIFISTEQLISILRTEAAPKGAVWITFDDGYKQNLNNVLPIIQDFNIPVTFFITTGALTGSGTFCWPKIEHYKGKLESFRIKNKNERYRISERKTKAILPKLWGNILRKSKSEAMTIDDVVLISKLPQITIGCHTVNHAIISDCTEDEIKFEVLESKKKLEGIIDKVVDCFAYPCGKFDKRGIKILKQNGFKIAATSENRLIHIPNNELLVPRFISMDDGFLLENVCHMVGIWEPIVKKFKNIIPKFQL